MHSEEEEDVSNVFAIPDFWKSSRWFDSSVGNMGEGSLFTLAVNKAPPQHLLGEVEQDSGDGYFKLPPLLDLRPVQDVQAKLKPPPEEVKMGSSEIVEPLIDDPWLFHDDEDTKQAQIRTWTEFDQGDAAEPAATFITEAGPAAFDALLAAEDNPFNIPDNEKYRAVDSGAYIACLLSLALGRSSLLYTWDDEKCCFGATVQHVKLQGYSGQSLEGLALACKDCGESTRYLQSFTENIYAAHASPARTALANAVGKLLLSIQSELGSRAEAVRSVLQLQALVQPVRSILVYFKELVKRLARSRSDEQLISMLFDEAHSVQYRNDFLRDTVCGVLRMVSKPWTDFVEEWVGLRSEEGIVMTKDGPGRSFVKVENKMWIDDEGFELEEPDYFLDEDAMPSFVPEDIAEEIFETGRNLRFLRTNHPEHRLARLDYLATCKPPKMEWHFDWETLSRVEKKAKEYEEALSRYLEHNAGGPSKEHLESHPLLPDPASPAFQFFGKDESQITASLLSSMKTLDEPVMQKNAAEDNLGRILENQLPKHRPTSPSTHDSDFNPHWSLLPLLSFGPLVAAQARAVNRECTRLLFTAHDLRSHLHLQRQYHLLGNGLFCSRLSHAFFDPDLDTAERRAGVALGGGVMGLRLSGRDTWPPASSELRLALMGVLAESYEAPPPPSSPQRASPRKQGAGPQQPAVARKTAELPSPETCISFAVRDLSADEMEACADPDSLAALDFLRLSYKPPPALLPVFTPAVLAKYDRVFRFLLRVLRMLYVVDRLFRDVVLDGAGGGAVVFRFRAEAHHFVTRLAAYLFESAVGEPWRRFGEWLDGVEGAMAGSVSEDGKGGRSYDGPDRVRERHEMALDEILGGLLLRRRQSPVMGLVEDVFAAVLGFAKMVRGRKTGLGEDEENLEVRRLYQMFKKKVEVFITVCRGMSEKMGNAAGAGRGVGREDEAGGKNGARSGEESGIGRLLLMLDMSDHSARKAQ